MKKVVKPLLLALGALVLFGGAFVGFARLRGAGLHELPVLGGLFPAPPAPTEEPRDDVAAEPAPAPTPQPAPRRDEARAAQVAGLGLLDVFRIESPLSAAELQALARRLERSSAELERRLAELDEREARQAERSLLLDEQLAGLQQLRGGLEAWELELSEREARLTTAEAEREAGEAHSWQRMAKLFEKGDAEVLARKLEAYTPQEAARLLQHLKPDRARALLEALTGEAWKSYWDAYRDAPPAAPQD